MNKTTPTAIERFAKRFAGYTKAHGSLVPASQTIPGEKADGKSSTVKETVVTFDHFERHLNGSAGLGIIPLDDDGLVRWGCIDIDLYNLDHVALIQKIRDLKLPLVVCRSKSGGAHCFLFLNAPSDAAAVRSYLTACAAALGHRGVEVFPKQTARAGDDPGSWLNLPYYYQAMTNRYAVTDSGGEMPLEDFLDTADAQATAVAELVAPEQPVELVPLKKGEKFVLPDNIPQGERNTTLFKYGCSLQAKGWADEEVEEELRRANVDLCDPPLSRADMTLIIKQALKYPKGRPVPDWVAELNDRHAVVAEAGKALIINTRDWDPAMGRRVITYSTFADFKNLYSNDYVQVGERHVPKGVAWLAHPYRRQYNGTTFAPGQEVEGWFNSWQGYSVTPAPGDWSLLKQHIYETVCGKNRTYFDYLLGWMAYAVQHPHKVPEVAVVLLGGRGTGKGILVNAHGSLMREHYVSVSNPEHVSGKFNAHLKDTVILFLDEAFWAGDKRGEGTLKRLITDDYIPVEKKRIDVVMSRNYCHVWVASNEMWAVPSGLDERRFFVLDVSSAHQQDHAYFAAIATQLDNGGRAAMLYDLLHLDLTTFNPRAAPMTPALFRQKVHSMEKKTAWWFECLWNGEIPFKNDAEEEDEGGGWRTQVAKEQVYDSYLEHTGKATSRNHRGLQTELGMFISSMLPEGWKSETRTSIMKWGKDYRGEPVKRPAMVPGWVLPDLATCRACFDKKLMNATEWPASERPEDRDIPF